MSARIKTAILISGSGSNMEALIKSAQSPDSSAEIVLVISNRPDAGGLAKAKTLGIKTQVIDHKSYKTRELFERDIDAALRVHDAQIVCNAGFMRILTPWFVRRWRGRQLNIHPSLLPKFKGLHTHARALEAGETEHGCTVHWVSEGMDDGEVIDQASVPVLDGDTPQTLAARVLIQEHKLYPQVLEKITRLQAN